jgi:hypothetical protein
VGGEGYWADIRVVGQAMLAAAEDAGDQVALVTNACRAAPEQLGALASAITG